MLSTIDAWKFNRLIEINALINSNYADIPSLLTRILEEAAGLCEGEVSALLLISREARELRFEITLGPQAGVLKNHVLRMGEGIVGWVALHNQALVVNDPEQDERYAGAGMQLLGYPLQAVMAVPLRIRDECIGVMELLNKGGGRSFSPDDLEWLSIFANQAALAIQNAGGLEKVRNGFQLPEEKPGANTEFHPLIAKSPVIREKLEVINRIAKTDSSVLILGESGVGKEIFAEQIHLRSPRRNAPFVRVNCAALPEGLLESELFGHVKGAFTSAVHTRRGRFELADGGTIFLDEIGDMPLNLQAKLLRVLQQRTFEKVGSDVSQTVNVRILAATNKDIEGLVESGAFRSDLYYRLNVLPLFIPPLRQRPEDIPELASFFLTRAMENTKKQYRGFSVEAMEAMLSYAWPGNIRELENCIERACVTGKDPWIQGEDLFQKSGVSPREELGSRNLKNALNVFKAQFIRRVLEEYHWNQTETARALDIQRTYLSRLIKELNITNPKEQ
jgi:Nif-specific regulatory protein